MRLFFHGTTRNQDRVDLKVAPPVSDFLLITAGSATTKSISSALDVIAFA